MQPWRGCMTVRQPSLTLVSGRWRPRSRSAGNDGRELCGMAVPTDGGIPPIKKALGPPVSGVAPPPRCVSLSAGVRCCWGGAAFRPQGFSRSGHRTKAKHGSVAGRLPTFMLRKGAGELVIGIFGRAFDGRYRILVCDVRTGDSVVFDDYADATKSGENRALLGTAVGPDGAGLSLYVRSPRGAHERHQVELMTKLWAVLRDRLAAPPQWSSATHRLRSTGPSGCLWI